MQAGNGFSFRLFVVIQGLYESHQVVLVPLITGFSQQTGPERGVISLDLLKPLLRKNMTSRLL